MSLSTGKRVAQSAKTADVRTLARKLLDSLSLIGDGDWTPQDVLAARLAHAVLAHVAEGDCATKSESESSEVES